MSDNVIEQAADELARVMTSPRSYCVLLAEALAGSGLLRPEIDDAMIERGYEAFVKSNPDLGEDVGLVDIEAALRAAIGGEQ